MPLVDPEPLRLPASVWRSHRRAVKRHLGLDDQPSWVIMREFNVFTWPGFDLAPVRSHVGVNQPPRFHYGHLPPALFRRLIETFVELRRRAPPDITPRDT